MPYQKEFINAIKRSLPFTLCMVVPLFSVMAVCMTLFDIPDIMIKTFCVAMISVFSFLLAFRATLICRHHGLIQGVICGSVMAGTVLVVGMVYNGYMSDYSILKAVLSVTFGMLGGVKGVNKKMYHLK